MLTGPFRFPHHLSCRYGRILVFAFACTMGLTCLPSGAAHAASDALKAARTLGTELGGAMYCQLDPERLQVLQQAYNTALAGKAKSARDLAKSQREMIKYQQNAARRGPAEGCSSLINRLQSPTERGVQNIDQRMQTLENLLIQQIEAGRQAQQDAQTPQPK